jgi:2-hydroxy-6-oxo-6-(2'-aminophenyl)hexa-2,4-dienoate hydrolase
MVNFPRPDDEGFASHFMEAAGIKTHYLEAGTGEPVVLVHGGGAGADAWGNWRSCLPLYAKSHRVFAVDMPGFGLTEKPDPKRYEYNQANRNKHLADFIAKLGLGPVNVVGNSMGGATSLGVVMARPDLVKKLVLMGSAGLDISNPDREALKSLGGYDFTVEGMRRVVRNLTGASYAVDEGLLRYRHELTLADDARAALAAIRGNKLTYPSEEIAKVLTPTLVVGGKEDKIAVLARTYGYLELLQNSWGFVLPHCGHWVMMEAPNEFVTVTTAFFRNDMFKSA